MARKITHIISDLATGGAEMMLYKLLSCMDGAAFENEVISLTNTGPVGEKIQMLGVPVRALGMRRGVPSPWDSMLAARLAYWLRRSRPDVVQTWMYHADLIGGLASELAGDTPVVWGVHHSYLDPQHSRRTTIWTAKACARLSGLVPTRIVCCSELSSEVHASLGYDAEKILVIPNGFDLTQFKPDPAARVSVRREFGVPEEAPLIGLVGRFSPEKDHHNFVQAAGLLHARKPKVRFLLCGSGVDWHNEELVRCIAAAGIRRDRCHLLGLRNDIPRLNAALDIATSSSSSEGFPTVIGEAMACGVPCVVTDSGDSAKIVGETGVVVPPRDFRALAEGWCRVLDMGARKRSELGEKARKRIEDHYSLESVTRAYTSLYKELA